MKPILILAAVLGATGCKSSDDGGSARSDEGVAGGTAASPATSCAGEVSGALSATFSGCQSPINHYPEGEESWIYSLLAVPSSGGTLAPPLESLGVNFVVDGTPKVGSYALADGQKGTAGHVYTRDGTRYVKTNSLSLVVKEMTELIDQEIAGQRTVLYQVHGSFEMVLADPAGKTVKVTATF